MAEHASGLEAELWQEAPIPLNARIACAPGEVLALVGPSGGGKSTILRAIAGLTRITRGHISCNAKLWYDTASGVDVVTRERRVGYVFQSYALFPHLSALENVAEGVGAGSRKDRRKRAGELLELVRLAGLEERRPFELSGGQQQRVALARALANHPKVLLLDEPLSALDLKLRQKMRIELKNLQRETGITFVFVTHDQEEALTMSDRIAVMNDGSILQVGTPIDIYEHPTHRFIADFIGETNLLGAEVVGHEGGESRVRLASGAERTANAPADSATAGAVTVTIRPERVVIAEHEDNTALVGRVENIVYFGTDTIYLLNVNDARPLTVRVQNRDGGQSPYAIGDKIAIDFPHKALQVLRD